MQDNHLYEYAVIRVVPKVEREEFINVGIILFSKKENYIRAEYDLDVEKLRSISPDADTEQLEEYLIAFKSIADGKKDCGPIAQMDVPSRFRWLTAVRSSILQTSRPHPGFAKNLDATLERLFEELVK